MNIFKTILSWLIPTAQAKGTKEWTNLPPWTSQVSVSNRIDAMDCLSESIGNIVYMMTGFDSSPRFTATLSGTTRRGNSLEAVMASMNRDGLLPYELWPTPDQFDWYSYYNAIPQDVKNQAIRCKVKLIPPDLNKSPLWTILKFPNGILHGVCQINTREYFDSELGAEVKPLNYGGAVIVSQNSINIKLMIDVKTVKFADNKTLGVMISSPNGVQIVKATGEEQWRSWSKPDSYGKPTVYPDGQTNWNAELTLNF